MPIYKTKFILIGIETWEYCEDFIGKVFDLDKEVGSRFKCGQAPATFSCLDVVPLI